VDLLSGFRESQDFPVIVAGAVDSNVMSTYFSQGLQNVIVWAPDDPVQYVQGNGYVWQEASGTSFLAGMVCATGYNRNTAINMRS